ncbi:MAG: Ribose ABC transport system, ATP-binding protein RbsA, partial [uncultured Thermomicrobiales bacterium]
GRQPHRGSGGDGPRGGPAPAARGARDREAVPRRPRLEGGRLRRPGRRSPRPRRRERRRQEHADAPAGRRLPAGRGDDHGRRCAGHDRRRAGRPAVGRRHRLPRAEPLSTADGGGEHLRRAAAGQCLEDRPAAARAGGAVDPRPARPGNRPQDPLEMPLAHPAV